MRVNSVIWVLLGLLIFGCRSAPLQTERILGPDEKAVVGDIVRLTVRYDSSEYQAQAPIDNAGFVDLEFDLWGRINLRAAGFTAGELAERFKYLFVERGISPPHAGEKLNIQVEIVRPIHPQ